MSRRLPRIWPGALAARLPGRGRGTARDDWGTFEREFWVYVGAAPPPEARRAELERLSRLLHEALVICEHVDDLLPEIRDDDGPAGALPHRAGPLISRLHAMRDELIGFEAAEAKSLARDAEALVNFYAQHLYHALSLLATSWRDERLREQREQLRPVTWAQRRLGAIADTVDARLGATA